MGSNLNKTMLIFYVNNPCCVYLHVICIVCFRDDFKLALNFKANLFFLYLSLSSSTIQDLLLYILLLLDRLLRILLVCCMRDDDVNLVNKRELFRKFSSNKLLLLWSWKERERERRGSGGRSRNNKPLARVGFNKQQPPCM